MTSQTPPGRGGGGGERSVRSREIAPSLALSGNTNKSLPRRLSHNSVRAGFFFFFSPLGFRRGRVKASQSVFQLIHCQTRCILGTDRARKERVKIQQNKKRVRRPGGLGRELQKGFKAPVNPASGVANRKAPGGRARRRLSVLCKTIRPATVYANARACTKRETCQNETGDM